MSTLRNMAFAIPFAIFAAPGFADQSAERMALYDAMGLPEMFAIMREEGVSYGTQVEADLFPDRGGSEWAELVGRIYDAELMQAEVYAALDAELDGDDVVAMLDFFTSDLGETIIGYEIAARRALLDDAVEEASEEAAAIAAADDTPRFQLVSEYVEANDLIETNIVGALNSSFAFYMGLMDGGAFDQNLTEDQILADVWSQEPDIRQSTTEWVFSFLMLAYQPLEDGDLQTYVQFSKTDAGQQLNDALFVAFDGMFERVSRQLGLGATRFMTGAEL